LDPDEIVIAPVVVIPESEAWLYRNPRAVSSVRKGPAEARDRRFAKATPDLKADSAIIAGRKPRKSPSYRLCFINE
jgi:hypothetical protein